MRHQHHDGWPVHLIQRLEHGSQAVADQLLLVSRESPPPTASGSAAGTDGTGTGAGTSCSRTGVTVAGICGGAAAAVADWDGVVTRGS
jgi:hypothetical protein